MNNGAYRLAVVSATGGLVLLMLSEPGSGSLYPSLGTALLLAAMVIAGLGKGVDWLGHVRDGALDRDDPNERQ
jgi:hypothetical protein